MRTATRSLLTAVLLLAATAPGAAARGLVDDVNPFVGTLPGAANFGTGGGAGNTFPGATTPFGMVAFSPDTSPAAPGLTSYVYADTRLRGFSLTHFSGAGLRPVRRRSAAAHHGADDPLTVGEGAALDPALTPAIDHRREQAAPGRYRVTLDPGTPRAIESELTATTRTGAARFTFPRGASGSVLVNAGGSSSREHRGSGWRSTRAAGRCRGWWRAEPSARSPRATACTSALASAGPSRPTGHGAARSSGRGSRNVSAPVRRPAPT